jgi:hypothetical protein
LLLTLLTGTVLTGGIGAADAAAAVGSQARADTAADASAHAAASLLAADEDRERLSSAVQSGHPCDTGEADPSAVGPACGRALQVARDVAARNRAVLLRLVVGPDLRDVRADRGAGRLVTLAQVAVRRGLPVLPATCPASPGSGSDLCWAMAWSAAQEAG